MITIRETQETDVDLLCEIQKEAFAPLYERYHDPSNPCLRGREDIANRLNNPTFRYFTIEVDGEIVGGVLYKCAGRVPFYEILGEGVCYLSRIYIHPRFQGQKIARTAILLCEQYFPDVKCFAVDFPQDLEKNRRCYEGAGFHDTDRRLETDPGVILANFEKLR